MTIITIITINNKKNIEKDKIIFEKIIIFHNLILLAYIISSMLSIALNYKKYSA